MRPHFQINRFLRFAVALLALGLGLIGLHRPLRAAEDCRIDPAKRILSNDLVRVQWPAVGASGPIVIGAVDGLTAEDQWYTVSIHSTADSPPMFRSRGKVVETEVLADTPDRVRVRVVREPDAAAAQALGRFEMIYEIRRGEPVVRHEMYFRVEQPLAIADYQFFVSTEAPADSAKAPAAAPHRLHFPKADWSPESQPAASRQPFGRIEFPCRHPWVALERSADGKWLSLGVPPADVQSLQYSVQFRRYELTRIGGWVTREEPLHDVAWFAFGQDWQTWSELGRRLAAETVRPSRAEDAHPPAPRLDRPPPPEPFPVAVQAAPEEMQVGAGGMMLGLDARTGAVSRLDLGSGNMLSAPGGLMLSVGPPPAKSLGPAGVVSNVSINDGQLSYHWQAGNLDVENMLEPSRGKVLWSATLSNPGDEPLLVEARFALPLRFTSGDLFYWDGCRLRRIAAGMAPAEMTTLVPGGYLSQGIFPAACLHDAEHGLAVGLPPEQIESFYGSRASAGDDPLDTFSYVVRVAVLPHDRRTVRFVLYPTDANWSWRSSIERYWSFWPEVFAAPPRNDIWGLYGSSNPLYVFRMGDRFIELCRRLHVGPLEMYAPFNRTGDFFPGTEPAYVRQDESLTQEQVRAAYDIANIATCNLSYVIPCKCDRALAEERYADSIIRRADGSYYFNDEWNVIGKGEKLAAMFAWGDSFGASLQAALRKTVDAWHPKGFYLDNGAFVWEDYGRRTPWSAYDDQGRVYTNGGIAYAMVLDDLRHFAPTLQRNPGEFIQYFSGFRANAHLTNVTDTHPQYVRTHRLIMGDKPIYAGRQDDPNEAKLFDDLELGALPWIRAVLPGKETFARTWAPVAIALARAGWRPVPRAVSDQPTIRVERFGDGKNTLFTVRNLTDQPAAATLRLAGNYPHLGDFSGQQRLTSHVTPDGAVTELPVEVSASGFLVLRAEPALKPAQAEWPAADFLARAEPCSILLARDASVDEQHIARRIKGFLEFQAGAPGHSAAVEIITEPATAAYPNHVRILRDAQHAEIRATGPHELTVQITSDDDCRGLLSDFLDAVLKRTN